MDATVGEEDQQKKSASPEWWTVPISQSSSNEEVVGNARVVLLAGYETTANTLAYTSYSNQPRHPGETSV